MDPLLRTPTVNVPKVEVPSATKPEETKPEETKPEAAAAEPIKTPEAFFNLLLEELDDALSISQMQARLVAKKATERVDQALAAASSPENYDEIAIHIKAQIFNDAAVAGLSLSTEMRSKLRNIVSLAVSMGRFFVGSA